MRLKSFKKGTLSVLAAFFGVCCAIIWIRISTVRVTYEFVRNEKELKSLQQQMQDLRVQWLHITSPSNMETWARQLQLQPPKWSQNYRLPARPNEHRTLLGVPAKNNG